ncbi:MAG: UDP-4-amino-4,6-dideoxy-N-acetyl-beta-L-altrosamine transaminase [Rhizobiaceae bacterium]
MSGRYDRFLPYAKPTLHEDDVTAVLEVLNSDFWTTGPLVSALEEAVAGACGSSHAVAVANGTAALHLAAAAAGIGPSSLVIVPDITFVATANAARYMGAEVLLCDVDPNTGLMTPECLAAAIQCTDREVSCVIPVHLAGQTVDMEGVSEVLRRDQRSAGAIVIEDASHAIGSRYPDGSPVGRSPHSAMATFSFHPVKSVATGEGGAITTSDPSLAARITSLRAHGISRDPDHFANQAGAFARNGEANYWYYEASELGFNYRLSDIHAALALSQIRRLDELRSHRAKLVRRYCELLEPLSPVVTCVPQASAGEPCWHLMVVLVDFAAIGTDRNSFGRALRSVGIGTQVHYIPLHRQPTLAGSAAGGNMEGAESYYDRCLSLPLFAAMGEDDVARVCAAIADIAAGGTGSAGR